MIKVGTDLCNATLHTLIRLSTPQNGVLLPLTGTIFCVCDCLFQVLIPWQTVNPILSTAVVSPGLKLGGALLIEGMENKLLFRRAKAR